jgi:hypothetical protein
MSQEFMSKKAREVSPSQARITAIRSPEKTGDSVSGSGGLEWRFIKTSNKG